MSNYHLKDENLSYKLKGLLSFMLGLSEINKEGKNKNVRWIREILLRLLHDDNN